MQVEFSWGERRCQRSGAVGTTLVSRERALGAAFQISCHSDRSELASEFDANPDAARLPEAGYPDATRTSGYFLAPDDSVRRQPPQDRLGFVFQPFLLRFSRDLLCD